MKPLLISVATAALIAAAPATVFAQSSQSGSGSGAGQEELIKKPNAKSATEQAPGQKQKSGEVNRATEAAPGQVQGSGQAGAAAEAAPGQMKKDRVKAEQKNADQTNQSASDNAPGQIKKSGEADTAAEAAPGQKQKSGEVNSAGEVAPGQVKRNDEAAAPGTSSETTASVDISTEQRTEVRDVIIEAKPQRIDVDFTVNVGVAVPRTVVLAPLPSRVIEIVPAYSGYEYFVLADGRIVIVEPSTFKIVYILVV